jgi:hypothetical protein
MTLNTNTREFQVVARQPVLPVQLAELDQLIVILLAKHSLTLLRISIGIVFVWFGALKLQMGLSPAEPLIRSTITFLPMEYFIPFLGFWEVVIRSSSR